MRFRPLGAFLVFTKMFIFCQYSDIYNTFPVWEKLPKNPVFFFWEAPLPSIHPPTWPSTSHHLMVSSSCDKCCIFCSKHYSPQWPSRPPKLLVFVKINFLFQLTFNGKKSLVACEPFYIIKRGRINKAFLHFQRASTSSTCVWACEGQNEQCEKYEYCRTFHIAWGLRFVNFIV